MFIVAQVVAIATGFAKEVQNTVAQTVNRRTGIFPGRYLECIIAVCADRHSFRLKAAPQANRQSGCKRCTADESITFRPKNNMASATSVKLDDDMKARGAAAG